ncbi:MAG: TetR/AcrR family transcriptional regulator [Pyrinomonadaceae bacterium]|nr:TetR/AcrR family transcriptional regulator [Pyrinomonadaceae bacterium]MCX7640058.1 TetR/AcrR family transcriptional regulator [Pyrinomonadaceae bacterium]MDW8304230.1 TetR/AcrR family transcriptional regulator [Acidobacteriota bacterium]
MKEKQLKFETAPRMSADERKNQILRIAIDLFSKKGFKGTTTKEIAQIAGISEAMLFKHFASKDELYAAMLDYKSCQAGIEETFASLEEAIEKGADDEEIFYGLILKALRYHESDQEFLRLLLHSALEGHEFSELFVTRKIAPIYELLGKYIEKRQKEGVFRDDVNARLIVRAFLGMMVHHSMNKILWDSGQRLLQVSDEEAARSFSDILLNGIRNKEVGQ